MGLLYRNSMTTISDSNDFSIPASLIALGQLFQVHNSTTQEKIPFIGEAKFVEYYLKYKGLLSSVPKWESPDVSCGVNPDFVDFFKLPSAQRQVRDTFFCFFDSPRICVLLTHAIYFSSDHDLARIRLFTISSSKLVRQIQDIMERKRCCQKGHILSLGHSMAVLNRTQCFLINVLDGMDC